MSSRTTTICLSESREENLIKEYHQWIDSPKPSARQGRPAPRTPTAAEEKFAFSANIDYKEAGKLRKYISEHGKILPRRVSGNCAKHQRELQTAIKRARICALLPYVGD